MADEEERDEGLDGLMANAFGTTAEEEYLEGTEDSLAADDEEGATEEEDEGDEIAEEDEELLAEDEDLEEDDEDEDLEEDDDTAEEDDSDVGDDDAESDPAGELDEGDGGEETLSDGLVALDMMVDQRLEAHVIPSDAFDPTIVGTEADFVTDAAETFGEDFDAAYAEKMGKLSYKTAVRTAKQRHDSGAEARQQQRRDVATARITSEVEELGRNAPQELKRVEARMTQIYQNKVDTMGVEACNKIPVSVWFRLAGGKLSAPKQKAPGRPGVASRKAAAQKQRAVRATQKPDQIGRVRAAKKGKKSANSEAFDQLNSHLSTHKQIEDFFFGD